MSRNTWNWFLNVSERWRNINRNWIWKCIDNEAEIDFETISYLVPKYHNHKSNEKIVIQYSLHIKNEDGNLIHKEVLENCSSDPRYKIAKKLTEDIPENANIMVYHKAFEKGIIEGLAKKFPEFKKHLMSYILTNQD